MPIVEASRNEACSVYSPAFSFHCESVSDDTIVLYFIPLLLDKVYVGLDPTTNHVRNGESSRLCMGPEG
jgi:hypothetical protein